MRLLLIAAVCCSSVFTPLRNARTQTNAADVIDRANMDTTCSACSDFFEFANGG